MPSEEIVHTDVLVELRPVNAVTAADEFPLGLFGGSPMSQPGVPRDGNGHRPTVNQVHYERVVGDSHGLSQGLPNVNP